VYFHYEATPEMFFEEVEWHRVITTLTDNDEVADGGEFD